MASPLEVHRPLQRGYVRNVAFAAEVIDAVTLEPIRDGIKVTARGLKGTAIVNASGLYVWLAEGTARPSEIVVTTGSTAYEPATVAVPPPPKRDVRIELAPRPGYLFGSGVTGVRGSLIERRTGPRIPARGVEVWLRWIDNDANGTTWVNGTVSSHVNDSGDFAAVLRLAPNLTPRLNPNGTLKARLGARLRGIARTSDEFSLLQGRVFERSEPFVWNEFLLSP